MFRLMENRGSIRFGNTFNMLLWQKVKKKLPAFGKPVGFSLVCLKLGENICPVYLLFQRTLGEELQWCGLLDMKNTIICQK